MGIFIKTDKKVLQTLKDKCEEIGKEITSEIEELYQDLNQEFLKNQTVDEDFQILIQNLSSKLSSEDKEKLKQFGSQISKIKHCAKQGLETVREISRDQKKATRETVREHSEYLYV